MQPNDNYNPLISIILPSYNHGEYIYRCIKSVIDQSYSNWELIIVDNNSNDKTKEILSKIRDKRIKIFFRNKDGLISQSRNLGINKSNGEILAFLDSDDWWYPNKLHICLIYIQKGYDLIFHDLLIKNESRKKIYRKVLKGRRLKKPVISDLLINGNPISNSSVFLKKKLIIDVGLINNSEKIIAAEDFHTWLKISLITEKFKYLSICLGGYTIHESSSSNKDMSTVTYEACKEFLKYLKPYEKKKFDACLSYVHYIYKRNNNEKIELSNFINKIIFNATFKIKIRFLFRIIFNL